MTSSTTFAQAKTYTEQAATQLGYTTADVASVSAAWQAVGVGLAAPPPSTALTNGVAVTGQLGRLGLAEVLLPGRAGRPRLDLHDERWHG